jgi:hypothetical protein
MENKSSKSFKRFFEFKGNVAPIAEKAKKNFDLKNKNVVNRQQRLHYFAIGHVFKNIDTENIFGVKLNEDLKEKKPTKFLALQLSNFTFYEDLGELLSHIRDLNSHFIHDFEFLRVDKIKKNIIDFLKQSFELAVLQTLLKENEISYEDFIKTNSYDSYESKIVNFLLEKFYPLNNKRTDLNQEETNRLNEYKEFRKDFKQKSLEDAINTILFVNVTADYDWNLFETHKVFKITQGNYLSFEACLFLLTMFLYKGEANQLISQIKGFKRNDDNKYRSKRNLFSFFAKKFSSQDIDSEENHLVKFRDLIQFLNHYPTEWNKDLELESSNQIMTNKLKEKIIEMEINRNFPDFANNERFLVFSKYQIFGKKYLGNNIEKEYIKKSFTTEEITAYEYEINISLEIKDADEKLKELKGKHGLFGKQKERNEKNIRELEYKIEEEWNKINPITDKLKTRVSKNLLYVSYGRNQDRFMEFAARFLAETNYFGKDAEFKMYQFYSSEEQDNALISLIKNLPKKQYDKLKFHKGKLIHFSTYENHLKNYESWDTPFVIENNAIQIKVTFLSGIKKIVSIQRDLIIYFLEDALYNCDENQREGSGKSLLSDYFLYHQKEFKNSKQLLQQTDLISKDDKAAFKKILPKRLLNHYLPAKQNNLPNFTTFQMILEKAKKAEKRYENLKTKADKEGNLEDFIKRNKGRQFKLQFIRKACNLMYFKDSYLQQIQGSGHHKRFHITKEEFNDFSKWMYAFNETPKYKDYLRELFLQKGFFDNNEFTKLFENSSSLDMMYQKTIKIYTEWLKTFVPEQIEDKYTLKNYEKFFEDDLFYINVSHFIKYLENINKLKRNENGNIVYQSLANSTYLINEYYYKDKLEKDEYKSCGKLYNKLKTVKLEDSLLYQLAMYYLQIDTSVIQNAKTNIIQLLNQDVTFNIKDANKKHLYDLIIPFNKINAYVELLEHKKEQEEDAKNKKTSFLGNLPDYINNVLDKDKENKENKELKSICNKYKKENKLTYDDLNKINNHIISHSIKFTKVALILEEYFIFTNNITFKMFNNRISFEEITDLDNYVNSLDRNKAFHFGLPTGSYEDKLIKIEKKFITEKVKTTNPTNYADLNKPLKSVCNAFLVTIHNNYFERIDRKKTTKEKREEAESRYFKEVIAKKN